VGTLVGTWGSAIRLSWKHSQYEAQQVERDEETECDHDRGGGPQDALDHAAHSLFFTLAEAGQWGCSSHDGPAPWGETSGPSNLIGEVVSRLGALGGISSFSGSKESDGVEPGLFQITGLNLFVERSANLAASARPRRSGGGVSCAYTLAGAASPSSFSGHLSDLA
jgi:hypothetical protein